MSTADKRDSTALRRGQFVVLAMIALAVAAATFAWWWNYNRGRRALEFFGSEAATLVRTAPKVALVGTSPESDIDISKAPGLLNARTSLLSDASYEWEAASAIYDQPLPAVRFSRGEKHVVVTFDFVTRAVRTSSTGRTATLTTRTAEGWKSYLARQAKNAQAATRNEAD